MSISVIIISVNSKDAREAMNGVLSQKFTKVDEIIIVGRGLDSLLKEQIKGVVVINHPVWINAASARNRGARLAKGDILLFIDDDCRPAENWIAANLEAFEKEEIGAVSGRMPGKSSRYFARCIDLSGFWLQQNNSRRYCETLYSATLGVRSRVFKEINGFDESIDIAEDVDFIKRLIKRGYKCLYAPEIVVYHEHKRDSLRSSLSYMFSRGREYTRTFNCGLTKTNFFLKIVLIFTSSLSQTLKTYRMNIGTYKNMFIYLPGIFIQYLAWFTGMSIGVKKLKSPETLIFFITSSCQLKCKHCFYWENLNRGNDLSFEEIKNVSSSLSNFKNLLISGGEPFLRKDIVQICELFKKNNKIELLSIPTNGLMPLAIKAAVEELLNKLDINITIGLSIDGMRDYHDALRGFPGAFDMVMETYSALAELKKIHPRLNITVNPTVTKDNMEEVVELAKFIKNNMQKVDYLWLGIARGNARCPEQVAPEWQALRILNKKINDIFYKDSDETRSEIKIFDYLFRLKLKIIKEKKQVVACQAGNSIGVLDANGDVRACELREVIGNVRQSDFATIWNSNVAYLMRRSIKNKECFCTHECFIYPSAKRSLNFKFAILMAKLESAIILFSRFRIPKNLIL